MRRVFVGFAVLLLACSGGERDGASSIYGSAGVTLSAEGSDMSAGESSSSADGGVTTTSTSTEADAESTGDTTDTNDPADGSDTTDDTTDTNTDTDAQACGNGSIDPGEQCDGNNLGGSSCVDHGFDGGVLACDPVVCVYDTSGCTEMPSNECDNFCNGCTCPSFECTMCCAQQGKVDACGGGMCGCF
jgi:hypothetical protein